MSLSNTHCSDSIKKLVSVKKFYLYRWNFANRKYVSIFSGTKIFLMTPSFCNLTIPGPDLCIHKTQMQYSLQTCQFLIAVNAKCIKSLMYYIQNNYNTYIDTLFLYQSCQKFIKVGKDIIYTKQTTEKRTLRLLGVGI